MRGLDAHIRDDWISEDESGPALRATAGVTHRYEHRVRVHLDVEVALEDGRVLTESYAHVGKDEKDATKTAVQRFVTCSLDPILCAFFGRENGHLVDSRRWALCGQEWDVFGGAVETVAWWLPGASSWPTIEIPRSFRDKVDRLVRKRKPGVWDAHWMRVHFAHEAGYRTVEEVLWDGVPWSSACKKLCRLSWDRYEGGHALRHFLILKRCARVRSGGPRRDYRWIRTGVRRLAEIVGNDPEIGQNEVTVQLMESGFDRALADAIRVLVPTAFATGLLDALGIRDAYGVIEVDGTAVEPCTLEDQPVFLAARSLVREIETRDRFLAVVARSPSFGLIESAYERGDLPEEVVQLLPVLGTRSRGLPSRT